MAFLDFLSFNKSKETPTPEIVDSSANVPVVREPAPGTINASWAISFDGEKTPGALGPILKYVPEYYSLLDRAWQSYTENDITKTIIERYVSWVIDKGLKLQAQPSRYLLESEGVKDFNFDVFNKTVESRFNVWANSRFSSHSKMDSLSSLAKECFKNVKIAGDALVVLRYDPELKNVNVQLIDGGHIGTPIAGQTNDAPSTNKIIHGVEYDSKGTQVAYHVRVEMMKWERIPAFSKSTGLRSAFLVYGSKYRLDTKRGFPSIASGLETLGSIERYKNAAVLGAEARQQVAVVIEHDQFSSGEDPMQDVAKMMNLNGSTAGDGIPVDVDGKALEAQATAATGVSSMNLPIGAKMKTVESKQEMFFKEFYETNANLICASIGIPPNVAFSLYNDSFSASRAATKDWEHTIDVARDDWTEQFYAPIYAFWLHMEVLNNKIQVNGYLTAFTQKNIMLLEAFRAARFTGAKFPHIDPLKEVKAERAKLGPLGENLPLTNGELTSEHLMSGDFLTNLAQFAKEVAELKKLMPEEKTDESGD